MTEIPTLANPVYRGETCRACQKPIVFVLTAKGRREPLERDPLAVSHPELQRRKILTAALRVVAVVSGQPQSLGLTRAGELEIELTEESPVYVAHFATCPERDRFRRSR